VSGTGGFSFVLYDVETRRKTVKREMMRLW